jgi:hypothetical protein
MDEAKRSIRKVCAALIGLICLSSASTVFAYHYFYLDTGGGGLAPAKWQTLPVNFVVSSNGATDITAEITAAAATWNGIATAKDVYGTITKSAVAFTKDNYGTAWGKLNGDGQQEVVLDMDGTIFARLGLDPATVNGFGPTLRTVEGGKAIIKDALLLLNGTRNDFDRNSTEVHEFGHNLGLAHSSVGMFNSKNATFSSSGTYSSPDPALDPIAIGSVPTMHPFSDGTGTTRRTPKADDIAGITELYPDATAATAFGGISGVVTRCSTDPAPAPVLGANVRAISMTDSTYQVSRYSGYDGNTDGRYSIFGLKPGSYKLVVEPMGANGFVADRMAINTRVDVDYPTQYYNPPPAGVCNTNLPNTAVAVDSTAGTTAVNKDIKVQGVEMAFVVDDTGSMSDEIDSVKTVLTNFVTTVKGSGKSFPSTAIISFKDDVTTRIISNDPVKLQSVIDSLGASGGDDCQESSNAALITAGRLMGKRGKAFFFTDADSRADGPNRAAVESLYRSKGLSLNAILTGTCGSYYDAVADSGSSEAEAKPGYVVLEPGLSPNSFDDFALPPVLGVESSYTTFSEIADVTGGAFTKIDKSAGFTAAAAAKFVSIGTSAAVSAVLPTVTLFNPYSVPVGSTNLSVQITGSNTNFQSGSVVSFSGTGITVNSKIVNSPTSITANISVDPAAVTGVRNIVVTTVLGSATTETANGTGSVNIIAAPASATLVSVSPPNAVQGNTNVSLVITAAATNFVAGTTTVTSSDSKITVNSVTVTSKTTLTANVTIGAASTVGYKNITVTTGSEVVTLADAIFVKSAAAVVIPTITAVSPASASQGSAAVTLTITGANTNFVAGSSVASFSGTGITVKSTTVSSPTSATVSIAVDAAASLGFRDVFMVTGSETASIYSALNITTTAVVAVNGVCGTANGQTFTAVPTANLCATGTASAISGAGPWSWSCSGSNSGTNASCATSAASTPAPSPTSAAHSAKTLSDALKAFKSVAGTVVLTADEKASLDVAPIAGNGIPVGNGAVDIADVVAILRRSIGIGTW